MAEPQDPPPAASSAAGRRAAWVAAAVAVTYLAIALWLLPAYGPVWDTVSGEYHWGERWLAALAHGETDVLATERHVTARAGREPHPDFSPEAAMPFPWFQVWPVAAILSALSCRLFWAELGWLPALVAHNLVIVVLVALLLGVMVWWCARRFGLASGVLAAALLILAPRFFADAFQNLKDVPETCCYTFALLAAFTALTTGTRRWWCAAGALAAVALAQKANALFVPVHLGLFLAWAGVRVLRRRVSGVVWAPGHALLGLAVFAASYFVLSPPLWRDPAARFAAFYQQVAGVGRAPSLAISPDGLLHVLWTTPPVLLALAVLGLLAPRVPARERVFVALGVLVPVGRTALPGMRNFDGVRHFLEFYPWLAILGGIGAAEVLRLLRWRPAAPGVRPVVRPVVQTVVAFALLLPGAVQTITTHPHGTCYFNGLIGGLAGARQRHLNDAGDYWAASYWQGLDWLNREAAPGAAVLVPIAGHVVAAAAPVKLRADLRLCDPRTTGSDRPIYVMFILREGGWDTPLMKELKANATPVHAIVVQGAPILWVFERRAGAEAQATLAALEREPVWLRRRFRDWLLAKPEAMTALLELLQSPRAEFGEMRERLAAVLPVEFHVLLPALDLELAAVRAALGK